MKNPRKNDEQIEDFVSNEQCAAPKEAEKLTKKEIANKLEELQLRYQKLLEKNNKLKETLAVYEGMQFMYTFI